MVSPSGGFRPYKLFRKLYLDAFSILTRFLYLPLSHALFIITTGSIVNTTIGALLLKPCYNNVFTYVDNLWKT